MQPLLAGPRPTDEQQDLKQFLELGGKTIALYSLRLSKDSGMVMILFWLQGRVSSFLQKRVWKNMVSPR